MINPTYSGPIDEYAALADMAFRGAFTDPATADVYREKYSNRRNSPSFSTAG